MLTKTDKVKLCTIGQLALQAQDDIIRSDGCWLMSYALDTEDDDLIQLICSHFTIALLVKNLIDQDIKVQAPSLKAVANLLSVDDESIIDVAISSKLIDNLFAMAQ